MGDFMKVGLLFFVVVFLGFTRINAVEIQAAAAGGIAADPFAVSMGGGCTALSGRPPLAFNNPASIAMVYQTGLSVNYSIFADEIKSFGAGFVLPFRNNVMALSHNRRGYDAAGAYYENSIAATYALNINDGKRDISLGANLRYDGQNFANSSDNSVSVDLGGIYSIPFVRGMSSAVVLRNVGVTSLLRSVALGLSYNNTELMNSIVVFDADFPSNGNTSYSGGVTVYPASIFRISAGWKEANRSVDSGPRVGAGLDFNGFEINYSLSAVKDASPAHAISIAVSLDTIFSPWSAADYSLKGHMHRAEELYLAKNYIQARHELEKITSLYRDYMPAHELLGKIAHITQDAHYKQEISRFIAKAEELFARNDLLTARRYYDMVLAFDPENAQAKSGSVNVRDAILEMQQMKVREENRTDITRIWKEAVQLYTKGGYITAKEKFLEILAIDKKHRPTREYITEIDNQLAKITAAQVNETFSAGAALFRDGKYSEAIRYFEAVVIAAPHRLDAEDFIAKCRQMIKEEENKQEQERLAKKQDRMRSEVEAANNRALQHLENNDFVLALEWFNKTDEIARRYEFSQYSEDARKHIVTIKAILADKHYKLGFDFYQKNRFESAYSEYRKSLQYNPENPSVKVELDRLARALAQQYYERGMSFYTQGQLDKAKEYIQKSLSYKPDKEESLRAIERMK